MPNTGTKVIEVDRHITSEDRGFNHYPELDYYKTIFRDSKDALLILKNRIFIDCNQAALKMMGYSSKDKFLNTKPADLSPEIQKDGKESYRKSQDMMDLAVKQGSHRFEWIHKKADGSDFPVEVVLTVISPNKDNELIYTTWRDISEQKNVLEKYTESENRFKSLMQQSPFAIEIYDMTGLQIEVNKAYEEMWEISSDSTLKKLNILKNKEVKNSGLKNYVLQAFKGETVLVPIYKIHQKKKNGNEIIKWLSSKIYPLTDKNGKVYNIVITHEDVTEKQNTIEQLTFSEERFRTLVETTSDFIWETDENGKYTYVSPKVKNILGYETYEMLGKTPFDFMKEEEKNKIADIFKNKVATGSELQNLVNINFKKNGKAVVLETSGVPFYNSMNELSGYRGIDRDITDRKQYEEQLVLTESVFDNTIEGIAITDPDGNIQKINKAFTAITGFSEREVIGQNTRILKSDRHEQSFYKDMWDNLISNDQWSGEIWNRQKDGSAYPEWLSISAIKDNQGKTSNYISLFHDITEKKLNEEKMQFLAFHDPLTKLPNRRLYYDRLNIAIESAKRSGEKIALFYLDIDNFKDINDTHGHPFGDDFLCTIAAEIKTICRKSDTLARYGGDEFAIVLNNIKTDKKAFDFSERLIDLFKKPVQVRDELIYTSLSIGLTIYPQDGEDIITLEKNADLALYEAKNAGKRQAYHYQEKLKENVLQKTRVLNGLREAIETFETFSLLYQPKINTKTNSIYGVEALLRWKLNGKPVSPDKFIPISEETNLIIPLGRWIIRKAMTDIIQLHENGFDYITLSINLSLKQFSDENLFNIISDVINETGFDKSKLIFEITEGTSVNDIDYSLKIMEKFKNHGYALSIDDFGTGYSSLSYLKKFNLAELKIDKSFIEDVPKDQNDNAICKTIINMAKSLNYNVVAEGVETKEQLDFLKDNGCYIIQGYLYFKPLEINELKKAVRDF